MKVNKDLADAALMLSAIIMVLVGTTEFESSTLKTSLLIGLGVFVIIMFVLDVIARKNKGNDGPVHP